MIDVIREFKVGNIDVSGDVLFFCSYWLVKCNKCEEVIDLFQLKNDVEWVDDDVDWGVTCPNCRKYINFYCPKWQEKMERVR